MQKKSHKIIALILFIAIILGTGFVMYHYKLKGRKSLRKGGSQNNGNKQNEGNDFMRFFLHELSFQYNTGLGRNVL